MGGHVSLVDDFRISSRCTWVVLGALLCLLLQGGVGAMSGIFCGSGGQYVGFAVDRTLYLFCSTTFKSSRPLVVVVLAPHCVCLLLKSPPTKNLGPILLKNAMKCCSLLLCLGGQ